MSAAAQRLPPEASLAPDTLIEALPVPVYTTDADGRITSYNKAAAVLWGRFPTLGEDKWCGAHRLYWTDGRPMAHDDCPMARTLKTGKPVRGMEAIVERPDGSRAVFMPFPTPLKDSAGNIIGGINTLIDTSDRHNADGVREHFAAIVASSDDAIISKDLNGIIRSWNKGAERIFGYSEAEAVGCSIAMLIPADRQDEEPGIIERIRRGERIDHYETKRQRKDGSQIDISLTVSPIRNSRGEVVGASKIARDITERKRGEEARELLLHEIKHRVKNTLGTVQAIASQTFRAGPAEEREAFTARLRALAGAHDLLTRQDFDQVGVCELIDRALGPFRQNRAERIVALGDPVQLNANQALLLAMVIHELATNAVKYGALSGPAGIVRIDWDLHEKNGRHLVVRWRESGGPPVTPPDRKGFGTTLIERALRQEQGHAQMLFLPAGIDCTVEMRL